MSVEKAIHERWAAYPPLLAVVPFDRLYTGEVPATDSNQKAIPLPAVGVIHLGDADRISTSAGTQLALGMFRFSIRTTDLQQARDIAALIGERYRKADFAYSRGMVQHMKASGDTPEQHPEGGWILNCDWLVRYSEVQP